MYVICSYRELEEPRIICDTHSQAKYVNVSSVHENEREKGGLTSVLL